jgi:hypothetical protein
MIVGVPTGSPMCLGSGGDLFGCLEQPELAVAVDPADPSRLVPSCSTSRATATPPRRFVELAQRFGFGATVTSICGTNWSGALSPLTDRLFERRYDVCLHHELPLAEGECVPDCSVVETLDDDRPCPEDPECPEMWCPAVTEGDLPDLAPCVDPATGAECRPYKRDLGLVTEDDGGVHRQCLVRAAARSWDATAGVCGPTEQAGWFYRPTAQSSTGCAEVNFSSFDENGGLAPGSQAELRCARTVCEDNDAGTAD